MLLVLLPLLQLVLVLLLLIAVIDVIAVIAMVMMGPAMQPEPEENEMLTTGQKTKRQLSVHIGK